MSNVVPMQQQALATFEEFWRSYPRRVGKAIAKAKWDAITSEAGLMTRTLDRDSGTFIELALKATPEEIVAGAKRYFETQFDRSKYRMKDDGRFTLHASTWLNRGGWMD